jgi:hypothetical protein
MIDYYTLNYIWLDRAGGTVGEVKSEVKVPAAAHEGEAGFASDCINALKF